MKTTCLFFSFFFLGLYAHAQTQALPNSTWQNSDFGYTISILFNADGSGLLDGRDFWYKIKGENMVFYWKGDYKPIVFQYKIQDDILFLKNTDNQYVFVNANYLANDWKASTSNAADDFIPSTSSHNLGANGFNVPKGYYYTADGFIFLRHSENNVLVNNNHVTIQDITITSLSHPIYFDYQSPSGTTIRLIQHKTKKS